MKMATGMRALVVRCKKILQNTHMTMPVILNVIPVDM